MPKKKKKFKSFIECPQFSVRYFRRTKLENLYLCKSFMEYPKFLTTSRTTTQPFMVSHDYYIIKGMVAIMDASLCRVLYQCSSTCMHPLQGLYTLLHHYYMKGRTNVFTTNNHNQCLFWSWTQPKPITTNNQNQQFSKDRLSTTNTQDVAVF